MIMNKAAAKNPATGINLLCRFVNLSTPPSCPLTSFIHYLNPFRKGAGAGNRRALSDDSGDNKIALSGKLRLLGRGS
jgi:hypothetical protein